MPHWNGVDTWERAPDLQQNGIAGRSTGRSRTSIARRTSCSSCSDPAEELRAVIPAMRSTPDDGDDQVLIGVTDRRVVLVERRRRSESEPLRVIDVTDCASTAPRGQRLVPHSDGHLAFDVDEDAIARLWTHIDDVDRPEDGAA